MGKIISIIGFLFFVTHLIGQFVFAQSQNKVLENYINEGLKSNLALKQQEVDVLKTLKALDAAKGMFLPNISIEARYSRAGGGRTIDMPIGDLLNPVYHSLNKLLLTNGFSPEHPANIPNQQILFLRPSEHDTKLRVIQPVFQPSLFYNMKIKKKLSHIEKSRLQVYKRRLIRDIKTSYFNYLKTVKVVQLLENTRELLKENLRVSESLFGNHKVTEEVVFRSKAELSKLDQQLAIAEKNMVLAVSYFNFLLNRPLESEIQVEYKKTKPNFKEYRLDELISTALENRDEFQQLKAALKVEQCKIGLYRSSILPSINAVLDYGYQGETYRFTGKDDYWMGSLLLSWNIFRGGQDKANQKRSELEKEKLLSQYQQLEKKITLQVIEAYHELQVSKKAIFSSEATVTCLKETFLIISKKYKQGMVPQFEYIDAQNKHTTAGIKYIISLYNYYIREAELVEITAINGNIPNKNNQKNDQKERNS